MRPNGYLTTKAVREEIQTRLGDSMIAVELRDKDYDAGLRDALRLLNRYRPQRECKALSSVAKETKRYPLSLDEHPGILGVLSVAFIQDNPLDATDPFALFSEDIGLWLSGDTIAEHEQQKQYIENARRVVSAEAEWRFDWEWDTDESAWLPVLYVDVSDAVDKVGYVFSWKIEATDSGKTSLKAIPDSDVDWVLDYATAFCKQILGRGLRKHAGVPTPEGGTDQTDGETLVTEAREELRELVESLKRRVRPLPPLFE